MLKANQDEYQQKLISNEMCIVTVRPITEIWMTIM